MRKWVWVLKATLPHVGMHELGRWAKIDDALLRVKRAVEDGYDSFEISHNMISQELPK